MDEPVAPLSPEWWVARLYQKLKIQRAEFDFFDAYYRGDHPLPWLAPQARDEFRRILKMTRSNYMGLVVDATAERMQVEGFRIGTDSAADAETWRIWQANGLDTYSDQAILESLIGGRAYMLVAPNVKDQATPHMWVEHPTQAIVEYVPGTNRRERAAGLKVWDDEWTGEVHATLYLPGFLFKFKTRRPQSGVMPDKPTWEQREVAGEDFGAANPLGLVPLVEIANNPRLLTGGVSEMSDVTDGQDRVNKTLADRLITQDFGAFPQKWAVAWPDEDEAGNPTPPIDVGRDRMVTTSVAETKFGQWDAAPLDPYSAAKREDVKDIAARTRTPAQYLLGEMSNVNGDTLKASQSGLIAKCRQRHRTHGEGFEDFVQIARFAAGMAPAPSMETVWRNPEFRTEGETTDAAVKKLQSGIASLRQARVDVGYSEALIQQLEQDDLVEGRDPLLADLLRPQAPVPSAPGG
jgi:hypothetical protein